MDANQGIVYRMTAAALSGPTLYPWDTGPAVTDLQKLLNAHGFHLRVDGDFGYITEAAVKEFQSQRGLRIDGIVGPKTQMALKTTLQPGTRLLHEGCTGADVCELQGLLLVNGYSLNRNGVFDEVTKQAILDFQQKHKLRCTGAVDPITWRVLRGNPLPPPPLPKRMQWLANMRKWW